MRIFKLFFKVIRHYRLYILIFLGIFFSMVMAFTSSQEGDQLGFEPVKMVVIDEDQSPVSKGLTEVFKEKNEVIDKDLTPQAVLDAAYQERLSLGLVIPQGFGDQFSRGEETSLEILGGLAERDRALVEGQADQYLATLSVYDQVQSGNLDEEGLNYAIQETVDIMGEKLDGGIVKSDQGEAGEGSYFMLSLVFLNYAILALALTLLSAGILELEEEKVRNRIWVSGYSETKTMGEIFLASFLLMMALWAVFILLTTIFRFSFSIFKLPEVQWALLASFIHMLACTSLSLFFVYLLFTPNSLRFFQTIFPLAIAFASGVFVDRILVDPTIHKLSSIFPTYWHVTPVYDSLDAAQFGPKQVAGFQKSIKLMALMMVAYFILALLVRHHRLRRDA